MDLVRNLAKTALPRKYVDAYRRLSALAQYLWSLSQEIHDRRTRLDLEAFEGRVASGSGFYQRMVKEVVDRTDLILQELDRRLEGVSSRHAGELRDLKEEIGALRAKLESLAVQPNGSGRPTSETPATDRDEAASGSRLLPD